jgi:hypothetical protein
VSVFLRKKDRKMACIGTWQTIFCTNNQQVFAAITQDLNESLSREFFFRHRFSLNFFSFFQNFKNIDSKNTNFNGYFYPFLIRTPT